MEEQKGILSEKRLNELQDAYLRDEKNALVRHALSRHSLANVIYDNKSQINSAFHFSIDIKTMPVCNQKVSGRCWIFAGLNFLRERVAKKLHLAKFELSQNYISFYDKLEKCNFLLESLLEVGNRPHDDRLIHHLLTFGIGDGGQWDMFVSLVKKYGVVPQDVFPETYQSNNTRETDFLLNAAIRNFASQVHGLLVNGKVEEARSLKERTLTHLYNLLVNAFGLPPHKFTFEYENDKGYHSDKDLTPLTFLKKYVGDDLENYQSLINSPTQDKPFYHNYTVDYLGGTVGGRPISHLNLPMERIKELIVKQLKDGEPVWFGSDVSFFRDRNGHAWDTDSFAYEKTFGFPSYFQKERMLDYWHSAMNHAMLITGVNLDEGIANRWKIENSWGNDNGEQGYYTMSANFFDTFVYQAVVNKKYLNDEEKKALNSETIHLNPWDPMGTLAD